MVAICKSSSSKISSFFGIDVPHYPIERKQQLDSELDDNLIEVHWKSNKNIFVFFVFDPVGLKTLQLHRATILMAFWKRKDRMWALVWHSYPWDSRLCPQWLDLQVWRSTIKEAVACLQEYWSSQSPSGEPVIKSVGVFQKPLRTLSLLCSSVRFNASINILCKKSMAVAGSGFRRNSSL